MEGWIKLHRKILESAVFKNPNLLQVWIYCLVRANHKENKILFEGREIILRPGQFLTGRFEGAKDCIMKPTTFWYQLRKLSEINNLDIKSDNKKSLITIINWGQYQNVEKISDSIIDNKITTTGQQIDTDNNVKNEKNEKNLEQDFFSKKNKQPSTNNWRHRKRESNEPTMIDQDFIQSHFSREINKNDIDEINNLADKYGTNVVKKYFSSFNKPIHSTKIFTADKLKALQMEISYQKNVEADKKNNITEKDTKNENFTNLLNNNPKTGLGLIETIYKERFDSNKYADTHSIGK